MRRGRRGPSPTYKARLAFSVSSEVRDALEDLANRQERTSSAVIRIALRDYLEHPEVTEVVAGYQRRFGEVVSMALVCRQGTRDDLETLADERGTSLEAQVRMAVVAHLLAAGYELPDAPPAADAGQLALAAS